MLIVVATAALPAHSAASDSIKPHPQHPAEESGKPHPQHPAEESGGAGRGLILAARRAFKKLSAAFGKAADNPKRASFMQDYGKMMSWWCDKAEHRTEHGCMVHKGGMNRHAASHAAMHVALASEEKPSPVGLLAKRRNRPAKVMEAYCASAEGKGGPVCKLAALRLSSPVPV